MSGFSPEWLSLREPHDHHACNVAVREAVAAAFSHLEHIRIVDLACGTGSNLRGLAPSFSRRQTWHLVDSDHGLLAAAGTALIAFADEVQSVDPLVFLKNGKVIEVRFQQLDLRNQFSEALNASIDLVSAAAFFDLVSEDWIIAFCAELTRRKLPLYTILNYSGAESWLPSHPSDPAMLRAFHVHQATDKGFGPAAGPRAVTIMAEQIETDGYQVCSGASPWQLTREDTPFIHALAKGIEEAVSETGLLSRAITADWLAARMHSSACQIGHTDLFAFMPGKSSPALLPRRKWPNGAAQVLCDRNGARF